MSPCVENVCAALVEASRDDDDDEDIDRSSIDLSSSRRPLFKARELAASDKSLPPIKL